MTRGTLRIRLIALAAAYALALQGLFAALAPVALATPGFPLCSGETADGQPAPGGHERACVTACIMHAADAPSVSAAGPVERLVTPLQRPQPQAAQVRPGAPAGPQSARAPPAG